LRTRDRHFDENDTVAIILLAGVGRRMGHDLPKSMIPLQSDIGKQRTTFIDRHIALLRENGVDHIVLVVNKFNAFHYERLASARVSIVVNDSDVENTGSSLSLNFALHEINRRAPDNFPNVIVMDGDIIYERRLAKLISDHTACSTLFVTPNISDDDEEVRVYLREGSPILIGKGITTRMADGLTLAGESLGIIKLISKDLPTLLSLTTWLAGSPLGSRAFGYSKQRSEHEEIWQYLFNLNRLAVDAVPADIIFSECDNSEDLAYIQEVVLPAIVDSDEIHSSSARR
jgi:choline kinase